MLGKLFAVLFAAIVVIASVVVTSIVAAAQTPIKIAFIGDLGVNSAFTHRGHFFIPSGVGTIPNNADDANHIAHITDHLAQSNLGNMYRLGQGVLKDYAEVARWFRRAHEQGDALAHFNLGHMYYRGQGVSQNYTEAVSWFRKAAEQGYAPAQTYLGLMYVLGWGVQQDDVQAHKWWSFAATKGNKQAQKNLDNITQTITPAQLAEAQKLAREWQAASNKRKAK
jgi:TPR repeat protein